VDRDVFALLLHDAKLEAEAKSRASLAEPAEFAEKFKFVNN